MWPLVTVGSSKETAENNNSVADIWHYWRMKTIVPKNPPTSRQRGRPRVTGAVLSARQEPVLAAAGRLLATRQSSEISVELLLQESGTSRPTFYRWFTGGMDQVFDLLIAKANTDLIVRIVSAISSSDGFEARICAGVRAYFDWGVAHGPVVSGIYREGFTEGSIAQRYRQQTVDLSISLVNREAAALGLTALPTRLIETLVGWVETAGAMVFRHYPVSKTVVDQQCELATQMFLLMVRSTLIDLGVTLR